MNRLYVTGTDTGVGKTLVTAALGAALRERVGRASIVKLAQTGVAPGDAGDAEEAGRASGCAWYEFARFEKPADPWNAALAEGAAPLRVAELAARLETIAGAVAVEGSGGAAVPLNEHESISDVAVASGLAAVVVVGLRLGCLSHTLLTLEYLRRREIPVRGLVCCAASPVEPSYLADVLRVLRPACEAVCAIGFDADVEARHRAAVAAVAPLIAPAG